MTFAGLQLCFMVHYLSPGGLKNFAPVAIGRCAAAVFVFAVATGNAWACGEPARFSVLEENDSLYFHSDKHYTQGLRLANLAPCLDPESGWSGVFAALGAHTPIFAPAPSARRYALFLGQSIFTPKNLMSRPPDRSDRPYAGWLYVGTSLLQEHHETMLENLEFDVGVVGPGAFGKQVQNDWHQFIGISQARGWSSQLQNEPGLVVAYERLWRLPLAGSNGFGVDAVPQLGAAVGNVFTYGEAGGLLRIGRGLAADYGSARVRPALSGTDYVAEERIPEGLSGYLSVGAQGRVVGRNIFLDGNSFRASPSVGRKTFVADLQTGLTVFWGTRFRVDFSVVRRTEEFTGQRTPDVIGTAALAFGL
jgi:hypothetical protein